MLSKYKLVFTAVTLLFTITGFAQQLAFPTAEGFGRYTTGGRGGLVYAVTNLNDDGPGSLRKGILKDEPRTIIFRVAGTIDLKSSLDINNGDLTIAGQSAPGEGITIKGYPVKVKANNVIIRYMRFRLGDIYEVEDDALGGRGQEDIIIDHCSISWATDENASFYWNTNFTMQWCIFSEALNRSVHSKGAHGYGGIWGGINASFHHNLIVSNNSRNPRFGGSKSVPNDPEELVDFRNNVIFNWGDNSIYGGEKGSYNVVNNYFKPGPATTSSKRDRIVNPSKPYGSFYVNGNHMEGSSEVTENNWNGGIQCDDPEDTKHNSEFPINNNIKTETAEAAFSSVLENAGASHALDKIDRRIVREVRSGKPKYQNGIIDSQTDVGGWPILRKGKSLADSDEDGMPDAWENDHGLSPDKNDAAKHDLDKGYTNLEVYLNALVADTNVKYSANARSYDFIVAQDGSGDFESITALVNALPNFRQQETKIFIKKGVYKEKIVLPSIKSNITFVGEQKDSTIITYDDYAQNTNDFGETIGTSGSSTCYIFANNFTAKNLTFENTAGPIGQAVAMRVDGDDISFDNCNFLGNQDTLYLHGKNSRQYYKNCYIEGTVDFIFGWSTAVFENCTVHSKSSGYVTAASTDENTDFGMVFLNCDFTGDVPEESVYLGRPWRDHAQTVLINCSLGNHIKKEGWHNWNKPQAEETVFYAEYKSTGPGASQKRVSWSKNLTKEEAASYTLESILKIK